MQRQRESERERSRTKKINVGLAEEEGRTRREREVPDTCPSCTLSDDRRRGTESVVGIQGSNPREEMEILAYDHSNATF